MSEAPKRPRAELLPIAEELLMILSSACVRIEIAGSLRRETPLVGDIELVAIPAVEEIVIEGGDLFKTRETRKVNRLWAALDGFFEPTTGKLAGRTYLKKGEKYRSFSWPTRVEGAPVQVDLFTATAESWGLIWLIRTGPWEFSKYVVTALKERGTPSYDAQVRRAGPARKDWSEAELRAMPTIPTPTEEDVFRLAALVYRDPRQRT